jgi:hypothetical protein
VYDLPLGMTFRKAVVWHAGKATVLRKMTEREQVQQANHLKWSFAGLLEGAPVSVTVEDAAPGIHRLPYMKTDESGAFPVANASSAGAILQVGDQREETARGAVVEFGGGTRD